MFIEWVPTDRSFSDIDTRFSGFLSNAIENQVEVRKWASRVRVCDIACWPCAWAIQELVKQYTQWTFRESRIFWIGIDYQLVSPKTTRNLLLKQGDLFKISQDTDIVGTVNVVYSAYIIGKLAQYREQYLSLLSLAVSQVSLSLAPGGIAFIDEWIYSMDDPIIPLNILKNSLEETHAWYGEEFLLRNAWDIGKYTHHLVIERRV